MSNVRPVIAVGDRSFGRGPVWLSEARTARAAQSGDLKLFAMTFLAGFVFVSMLLA